MGNFTFMRVFYIIILALILVSCSNEEEIIPKNFTITDDEGVLFNIQTITENGVVRALTSVHLRKYPTGFFIATQLSGGGSLAYINDELPDGDYFLEAKISTYGRYKYELLIQGRSNDQEKLMISDTVCAMGEFDCPGEKTDWFKINKQHPNYTFFIDQQDGPTN